MKLTPQERRLLEALSQGVGLKGAGFAAGICESTAKQYLLRARQRNACTTFQLMFMYGQERAASHLERFMAERRAA